MRLRLAVIIILISLVVVGVLSAIPPPRPPLQCVYFDMESLGADLVEAGEALQALPYPDDQIDMIENADQFLIITKGLRRDLKTIKRDCKDYLAR